MCSLYLGWIALDRAFWKFYLPSEYVIGFDIFFVIFLVIIAVYCSRNVGSYRIARPRTAMGCRRRFDTN